MLDTFGLVAPVAFSLVRGFIMDDVDVVRAWYAAPGQTAVGLEELLNISRRPSPAKESLLWVLR